MRIAVCSDIDILAGTVEPRPNLLNLDLLCDGVLIEPFPLDGWRAFRFEGLEVKDTLIELWLSQAGEFRLCRLELRDSASLRAFEDERHCSITYGSSITQCKEIGMESPTQTWPAIVVREHGFNLTYLGYGGQCHLARMVARMMRDLSADFVSLCVGINIQGRFILSPRTFRPALISFIRERHPDIPLLVTLPIHSAERETRSNKVGFHFFPHARGGGSRGRHVPEVRRLKSSLIWTARAARPGRVSPSPKRPSSQRRKTGSSPATFYVTSKTGGSFERTPNRGI